MKRMLLAVVVLATAAGAAGWWWLSRSAGANAWQGYVDAEYVRVSPTLTGRCHGNRRRARRSGGAGALLFTQDDADDVAARDAAAGKLAETQARLGQPGDPQPRHRDRAGEGRSGGSVATRDRITRDLARNEELLRTGAASRQTVDQQRADLASATARVEAATAKLAQMQSPTGREYEIAAQTRHGGAGAGRAGPGGVAGEPTPRHRADSCPGVRYLCAPGETINAGVPVVSLLPPQNILVRFFVPETELATLHVGDPLAIGCDACAPGLTATVTFIATQPEYTPPVIYSETNREKLVYLIEAHPPPDQAMQFKPGQPVDVRR